MKKFFAALLCVAAITLVGCKSDPLATGTKGSSLTPEKVEKMDNTTEKCWHFAVRATYRGESVTEDSYVWCTERVIAAACLAATKQLRVLVILLMKLLIHLQALRLKKSATNSLKRLRKTNLFAAAAFSSTNKNQRRLFTASFFLPRFPESLQGD